MIPGVHLVEGSGVECAIAQKFINCSVKLIRARTGHDVDLPTARAAHLGGITSSLNLELLHGVRRRADIEGVERRVCIGRAVEKKVVRVRPISPDTDRRTLSGPPIKRIHITGLRAMTQMRARNS